MCIRTYVCICVPSQFAALLGMCTTYTRVVTQVILDGAADSIVVLFPTESFNSKEEQLGSYTAYCCLPACLLASHFDLSSVCLSVLLK